jgi:hypothetical protein
MNLMGTENFARQWVRPAKLGVWLSNQSPPLKEDMAALRLVPDCPR